MRLCLDSNVFISFVRSEIDGAFNLRYKDSENFFTAICSKKIELVISEFFFFEVKKHTALEKQDVIEILEENKIPFVLFGIVSHQKAKEILLKTGIHFSDAVHIANAIETKCDAIITWNKKDFENARHLIASLDPQELVRKIP